MALATYTVKRGDNLTKICDGRCGADVMASISGNTVQARINTLVDLNGIANPNIIITGQVLKLSGTASASSSSSSATPVSNKVTIHGFGLQAGSTTGRDMFVYWTWDNPNKQNNLKHYRVRWEWFVNGHLEYETSEVTEKYSNKTGIPKEASYCQVFILPVAENKLNSKGEDTGVPHWTAEEKGEQYQFSNNPPLTPPAPDVEIDNNTLKLTASISNIIASELDAVSIKFNVVRDNSDSIYTTNAIRINTTSNYVAHPFNVEEGHSYTVRAMSVSDKGKESGWSDFSDPVGTKPSAPTISEDQCRRVKRTDGSIAAHLEWSSVPNATSYKIEYVTTKTDFDTTPDNIQEVPTDTARTSIEIIIGETGKDYYFRVKAVNKDNLESNPSGIVTIPIGSKPSAPSTWSTSDSAFEGDTMELHWMHQSTDNSKQTSAQLDIKINDGEWVTVGEFQNTTDADNTGDRVDEVSYTYGTSVSYKGTLYFKMDTSNSALKNAKIQWRVKTKGIIDEFGDWSVERTINIYEKPTLILSMTNDSSGSGSLITTLTRFPFYIRVKDSLTTHRNQKPVGYHIQITSKEYYVTVDDAGRTKTVNAGDVVYSKYFSTDQELITEISADNIDLESSVTYIVQCFEDMSTGLVIENQHEFTVNWVDAEYPISADISVNTEAYTALITPYCVEKVPAGPGGKNLLQYPYTRTTMTVDGINFTDNGDGSITINGTATARAIFMLHDVSGNYTGLYTVSGGVSDDIKVSCEAYTQENVWIKNATVNKDYSCTIVTDNHKLKVFIDISKGTVVNNVTIYPQLELNYNATEYEPYYNKYIDGNLIENVTLSVYRREYDGTYTEIASGIPNNYTSVTDPHPALDYARYRFVAKDISTGAVSFFDKVGYPVNASTIILQWAEERSTFDTGEEQSAEGPPWSGSLLKLPYNIKVTDQRKPEVALVEYAGRRHPVSYYGTQVGETSQWNTDIPKDDKETIYALRRLSLWTGDVYVREPSGMGYWANVEVSFNQSYNEVTIPVTLGITRVEGGV